MKKYICNPLWLLLLFVAFISSCVQGGKLCLTMSCRNLNFVAMLSCWR